eukprot:4735039-Amphidinium_carterae.1
MVYCTCAVNCIVAERVSTQVLDAFVLGRYCLRAVLERYCLRARQLCNIGYLRKCGYRCRLMNPEVLQVEYVWHQIGFEYVCMYVWMYGCMVPLRHSCSRTNFLGTLLKSDTSVRSSANPQMCDVAHY